MLSFVHGYASWLPCFIDLDESEVVMNHHIRPATDSDYLVQIEAKLNDDPDWTTSSIEYPADQISVVSLRLKVPPELEHVTVQYVIEVVATTNTNNNNNTTTPPPPPPAGASFVQPPTKCHGSRSHGNQYDEVVQLQVNGTTNTATTSTLIELVAGWATGHAPVTLTPKFVLTRQGQHQQPPRPSSDDQDDAEL